MAVQMQSKSVVSVAEMARMCSLSRARFYQLVNEGIFPHPVYDVFTRRPFFTEEMQAVCLEVRRKNCGVNGRPILFCSARSQAPKIAGKPKLEKGRHVELLAGLKALGLEATALEVENIVSKLFPNGVELLDQGQVIRQVFLELKRQKA